MGLGQKQGGWISLLTKEWKDPWFLGGLLFVILGAGGFYDCVCPSLELEFIKQSNFETKFFITTHDLEFALDLEVAQALFNEVETTKENYDKSPETMGSALILTTFRIEDRLNSFPGLRSTSFAKNMESVIGLKPSDGQLKARQCRHKLDELSTEIATTIANLTHERIDRLKALQTSLEILRREQSVAINYRLWQMGLGSLIGGGILLYGLAILRTSYRNRTKNCRTYLLT